jgi:transcriptional regulator with XRE-family HTH domain
LDIVMRLSQWMKKSQCTQVHLSKLTGIDQSLISKHLRNERKPKGPAIRAYHEATNGEVTFEDWFPVKKKGQAA